MENSPHKIAEPMPKEQLAAWDELQSILADTRRKSGAAGLSPEQIDELIDDECAAVRHGRNA